MVDTSLLDLDPTLRAMAQQWLQDCAAAGLDVRITETWRSPTREDELHAQGVTRATGATCNHCSMIDGKPASRAFDFAAFRNGVYIQNGEDVAYAAAGKIAEGLGLEWGGSFTHPDADHIQLPDGVGSNVLPFPKA